MVVLWGVALSYERGTPVVIKLDGGPALRPTYRVKRMEVSSTFHEMEIYLPV